MTPAEEPSSRQPAEVPAAQAAEPSSRQLAAVPAAQAAAPQRPPTRRTVPTTTSAPHTAAVLPWPVAVVPHHLAACMRKTAAPAPAAEAAEAAEGAEGPSHSRPTLPGLRPDRRPALEALGLRSAPRARWPAAGQRRPAVAAVEQQRAPPHACGAVAKQRCYVMTLLGASGHSATATCASACEANPILTDRFSLVPVLFDHHQGEPP